MTIVKWSIRVHSSDFGVVIVLTLQNVSLSVSQRNTGRISNWQGPHSKIENSPSEIGKVGKGNSRGWSCQKSEGSRSGTQMF